MPKNLTYNEVCNVLNSIQYIMDMIDDIQNKLEITLKIISIIIFIPPTPTIIMV